MGWVSLGYAVFQGMAMVPDEGLTTGLRPSPF